MSEKHGLSLLLPPPTTSLILGSVLLEDLSDLFRTIPREADFLRCPSDSQ